MTERLLVDLVADPVCPWCFVGLKSWLATKPLLEEDFQLVARMRPYQLNPDTPINGADRQAYYERKFPDAKYREEMTAQLIGAAEEVGVTFDPKRPEILPNTLAAHTFLHRAHFDGLHEKLAERLYDAFWHEGADIGKFEILCALAEEVGMDVSTLSDHTDDQVEGGQNDYETVRNEANAFRNAGVSGVPTFIINEKIGFSGALPPSKLNEAIRQANAQSQS